MLGEQPGRDAGTGDGVRRPFGERSAPSPRAALARRLAEHPGNTDGLNGLAGLAASLLGAASAQVSLVGDEQVVLGGAGAGRDMVGVATPSEHSLCSVVVRDSAPVLVDRAADDPRVAHLPPVASGAVGAYLGVPLRTGGHVVGALCVFDTSPRAWTERDRSVLERLAGLVVAELELAAVEAGFEEDRALWLLAVDAAGVGMFDWDLASGELRWDETLLALFGLDRSTFGGTIEAFNATVHPVDQPRVSQALADAIRDCGYFDAEYRIALPTGDTRWVTARGRAVAGPDGTAERVLGAAFDSTATREVEARLARILETMPSAFFHLDATWRFTYVNAEAERLLGAIGSPLVDHVIWELFPAAVGSDFERHYRHAVSTEEPVTFEAYYPPPLDDWYEVRAWPTVDGLSVYFHDITHRRIAELALHRANQRAELLAEVTKALTDSLEVEHGADRLARLLVPALGDWCMITLVDGEVIVPAAWRHHLRDVASWHVDPHARLLVERHTRDRIAALTDDSLLARALTTGELQHVDAPSSAPIAAVLEPGPAHELSLELDPRSVAVVPFRGRGRTTGLLTVVRGEHRDPFGAEDLGTLLEVAQRAGLALDNARAYSAQRDLAAALQRSLLTAPPQPDHLQIAVRYEPAAEAAQVGGDWYDAFLQPDGATIVAIGDVVGHDTAAAAAMGQVRGLLRGVAVTTGATPGEVLRRVDEAMTILQVETTATAVVARFEQSLQEHEDGLTRLRWSNAGHPPPLIAVDPAETTASGATGPTGPTELVTDEPDLLLGLDPTTERTDSVVTLPRGATVLLYTDGLVERRGQSLDEGTAQLRRVLGELVASAVPLDDMCDEILRQLMPESPEDDVALVAVRLHREDRPRPADAGPERVPDGLSAEGP